MIIYGMSNSSLSTARSRTMGPYIVWLVLAVSVLIGQSNILADAACTEDYWPCTCHNLITSTNQSRLIMLCNDIKDIEIIPYVFQRISPQDIYAFHMTIPKSVERYQFDIDSLGKSVIIRNFHFICSSETSSVGLRSEYNYRFTIAELYVEHIQVDNCNFFYIPPEFRFLRKLTLSRMFSPYYFQQKSPNLPGSITMLNITHSSTFQGFHIDEHYKFFFKLTSLAIDYCPSVANFEFLSNIPNLQRVFLNGNQMNDSTVAQALNSFSLETKSANLRTLSLMDNGLTQIPETDMFFNLTTLMLDKNNITKLTSSSLQHFGSQLKTLSLSSCGMDLIEPGALEGNFHNLHLNLDDNNLTRFDSAVFKKLLEKMARWGSTGSIRLHGNPFDCDCHLAWLVNDNRHLLNYLRGARCAFNGPFFKDPILASQLAVCGDSVDDSEQ